MDTLAQAKEFFLAGVAHFEAGRFDVADRQFTAALALAPGRASILVNLGATRLKLGRFEEAAELLGDALRQEPGDAQAWGHRATALAELGRHQHALESIDRAIDINPAQGAAWTLRGTLLREMGRPAPAAAAYRRALECGADPQLTAYYLAALDGNDTPEAPPPGYVETLFDTYADGFEEHLLQVLHYRAPDVLAARLRGMGRVFAQAVDLGCGTGLCGPLLRPMAIALQGVDLSANMVRQAQARGAYDSVVQADAQQFLRDARQRFDLVVAADVFIYVGALEGVFEAAAAALVPQGVFCFSVEKHTPDGFALRTSLRYAHSASYLAELAARNGFAVTAREEHPIREDQGRPIAGLYYWLTRR
ncbi:tetratricopeptide repeat protein [Caenimonas aquaedulcis]|uniref:Tetratricopeptide repeat protein n=1 Tax=Caenimonas aquaedulcis TaxID=2793270 RepID=A0A931H4U0_9BURK|nr:tetratricopeptide repeat protein [Caenimonas aquaedulcis]MBG9388558.1 tetratricopeptide repeat protein [Caenimonas aquaedulcis]